MIWLVVLWRTVRIVVVVVVVMMMVVVVVPVVASIPPVMIVVVVAYVPVPVVPRVSRISPPCVVEWIYSISPAVVPRRGVKTECHVGCTPRTKHRCHVAWLHPYLVARYHDVVVGWVVCRGIYHSATCEQVVVARWQVVGCRLEAVETTCVCTLVVVGYYIDVVWCVVQCCIVLLLCGLGVGLSYASLPLCLTSLRLQACSLGFSLQLVCHLYAVVGAV